MVDRLRGHKRRFSDAGSCSHPSAESTLIARLDGLDIRLRQLEKKQLLPESYFAADLQRAAASNGQHHHCKSLSSALHDVRLKGILMDRLHLLETRIQQLSSELEKGGKNANSSTTIRQVKENEQIQLEMDMKPGNALTSSREVGGAWRASDMFEKGTRELQSHKTKTKDSKEAINAMEKKVSAMCHDEKRRSERNRIYRRWFPVGC